MTRVWLRTQAGELLNADLIGMIRVRMQVRGWVVEALTPEGAITTVARTASETAAADIVTDIGLVLTRPGPTVYCVPGGNEEVKELIEASA